MSGIQLSLTALERDGDGLDHARAWLERVGDRPAEHEGMTLMEDRVRSVTITSGLKGLADDRRSALFVGRH